MDLLRRAVGDKKLTYLGFSYGTRIGAEYARLAKAGRVRGAAPARRASGAPFTPRGYAYLALSLAVLAELAYHPWARTPTNPCGHWATRRSASQAKRTVLPWPP